MVTLFLLLILNYRELYSHKFHPTTGREGPEGGYRYRSIFSLISAWRWWLVVHATPMAALPPRKTTDNHCTGSWVGLRACMDGCGKSFIES
jgi:hypothetical protein